MYPPFSPQQNHGSTLFSVIKKYVFSAERTISLQTKPKNSWKGFKSEFYIISVLKSSFTDID